MKKSIFALMVIVLISSCSTDAVLNDLEDDALLTEYTNDETVSEDPNNDTTVESLSLSRYELTFYPSENQTIFEFQDGKAIKHTRNGIVTGEYEYDTNDRMLKYTIYSNSTGELDTSYTFEYEGSGKISAMTKYEDFSLFGINEHKREMNYDGKVITTTFAQTSIEYADLLSFTMNDDGKIAQFEQLDYDESLEIRVDFEYNDQKNCSKVILTAEDFNGMEFQNTYEYSYDEKQNPLFEFYSNYYMNIIFINGEGSAFGLPMATSLARTMGPNNITTTVYPSKVPEAGQYFFEYDYNSSGYPERGRTKNVMTQANSVVTNFFYN